MPDVIIVNLFILESMPQGEEKETGLREKIWRGGRGEGYNNNGISQQIEDRQMDRQTDRDRKAKNRE